MKLKNIDNLEELIVLAITKLTPIKPRYFTDFEGFERPGCPCHDNNVILYAGQKYCSVCGQCIDWNK